MGSAVGLGLINTWQQGPAGSLEGLLEGSPDSQVLSRSPEEDAETIVCVWALVSACPSKNHSLTFIALPLFPTVGAP